MRYSTMQTILFHSTIFGPIHSRRLGTSLGVNLSPADGKVCSFDCLYCEAGFNAQGPGKAGMPPRAEVKRLLNDKLSQMKEAGEPLDVITFSGNGEPTMHPDFEGVIADTIELRDKWFPGVKISVLSNSTRLDREGVERALRRVDNNILKLDSALTPTLRLIDRPVAGSFTAEKAIEDISRFSGQCTVQTMLVTGSYDGHTVDNTTEDEIEALLEAYKRIRPRDVMLYSIDRKTPAEELRKVPREVLEQVAERVRALGIPATTV